MTPSFFTICCDFDSVEMYLAQLCLEWRSCSTLDPESTEPFRSLAMVSIRESNCPMEVVKPISSSSSSLLVETAAPITLTKVE